MLPSQPVATMLQYRLYGGKSLPAGLQGFVKAGANIGSVIGQFSFGKCGVDRALFHQVESLRLFDVPILLLMV
jgi:hypothetical protein